MIVLIYDEGTYVPKTYPSSLICIQVEWAEKPFKIIIHSGGMGREGRFSERNNPGHCGTHSCVQVIVMVMIVLMVKMVMVMMMMVMMMLMNLLGHAISEFDPFGISLCQRFWFSI